jgi:hypothetical protein
MNTEYYHLPPSSAEVNNAWGFISTLHIQVYGVLLGTEAIRLTESNHLMTGGETGPETSCTLNVSHTMGNVQRIGTDRACTAYTQIFAAM